MTPYSLCYGVRKEEVRLWTAKGDAGKLRKRITCPECSSRVGRLLAEIQRLA